MSDRSAAVELRHEEAGTGNGRLAEEGVAVAASNGEKKLDLPGAQQFPVRTTMPLKKKAKRKDDGPLEIVCKWVVEYQVGTKLSPPPHCCPGRWDD
jgi:acyl-CoA-dependent ceramide synthase